MLLQGDSSSIAPNTSSELGGDLETLAETLTHSLESTIRGDDQQNNTINLTAPVRHPVSIMALLNDLEASSKNRLVFTKLSAEEKFVQNQLRLHRDLNYVLQHRQLIPISSVAIPAEKAEWVVLIFTPSARNRPYVQGRPKKQDAKLFIRLQEFDRTAIQAPEFAVLLNAPLSEIPVRELLVRSSLCRSILEIGQRNINFGLVAKREIRSKTIVINNRSESPLLYVVCLRSNINCF
jgi:hypothetical protein